MKRNTLHIRSFLLSLFMLLTILFGAREAFAYADKSYTGAIEDLSKAENFDPSYYPVKENDYTISPKVRTKNFSSTLTNPPRTIA